MNFLDPSADKGDYLSDAYWGVAFPLRDGKDPSPQELSAFRDSLNGIVMDAMEHAEGMRREASDYADARIHLAGMQAMAPKLRRLADRPITLEAAFPFVPDEEDAPDRVIAEMGAIAEKANELAILLEAFSSNRSIGKAINLTSGDPLRHQFFRVFAEQWRRWTGKPVPRKGSGLFVDLMVAVWTDMDLPKSMEASGFLSELARKKRDDLFFASFDNFWELGQNFS